MMYSVRQYLFPRTLEEAHQLLHNHPSNTIIGGSTYLRLGGKTIDTAVDISRLGLKYIMETEDTIVIGAGTTLREVENSPLLNRYFNGILNKSVRHIVGVQLRNLATVGANVFARFGFSDLNTALLTLDVDVELYQGGLMPLRQFLQKGVGGRDILVKLIIQKSERQASFQMLRNSQGDYAILNAAVSRLENDWRIVVGARPGRCEIAGGASAFLGEGSLTPERIDQATQMAVGEMTFGSNIRGSKEYRQGICPVLIKRAVQEVLAWK
ncbi:FAD binding domain-containing protein [Dehalobacterium formicoaceticum]